MWSKELEELTGLNVNDIHKEAEYLVMTSLKCYPSKIRETQRNLQRSQRDTSTFKELSEKVDISFIFEKTTEENWGNQPSSFFSTPPKRQNDYKRSFFDKNGDPKFSKTLQTLSTKNSSAEDIDHELFWSNEPKENNGVPLKSRASLAFLDRMGSVDCSEFEAIGLLF